jgi:arylsulfatase
MKRPSTIQRVVVAFVALSAAVIAFVAVSATDRGQAEGGAPDRSVLPIAEPARPVYTELDVRNATAPPRFEVRAPEGSPNVVVVLVDDLGFACTSMFGGPVGTPTFDRLAADRQREAQRGDNAELNPILTIRGRPWR